MLARAKALELDTPYEPPPGDALSHHTSGLREDGVLGGVPHRATTAEFAAEHVGYFTGPYEHRAKVGKPVVDMVEEDGQRSRCRTASCAPRSTRAARAA
jgi:hypothetical protein